MGTKSTFTQPWPEEAAVPTSIRLLIRGLAAVPGESGLFELSGVKPRSIDHNMLAIALGYEPGKDPELEDKVLATVWRFDMVRLLTDRIEV